MTAIVPSVTFPDITHLLLESYLGTTTGILDWQNFRSIAPPDDGSLAYAGAIWPNQYTGEPAALRNRSCIIHPVQRISKPCHSDRSFTLKPGITEPWHHQY